MNVNLPNHFFFSYLDLTLDFTSCDELKDLGGWKTRSMVDRYAKFATENLAFAASRIELSREGSNVIALSRFCHVR